MQSAPRPGGILGRCSGSPWTVAWGISARSFEQFLKKVFKVFHCLCESLGGRLAKCVESLGQIFEYSWAIVWGLPGRVLQTDWEVLASSSGSPWEKFRDFSGVLATSVVFCGNCPGGCLGDFFAKSCQGLGRILKALDTFFIRKLPRDSKVFGAFPVVAFSTWIY